MTLVRRLSAASAASTLALVAVGGIVRATGSGDACPDWPRCFGRWIPPPEFHTLIEYSHRLAAVITGVLILATAWVAWRRARGDPGVLWPAAAAVLVVIVQAGIGRIRILADDPAKALIVTIHFLVAMALVTLVVAAATAARVPRARPDDPAPASRGIRRLLRWTLGATALLLVLGAYVRGEGASLVFLDWPLMDGRLIPDLESRDTIAAFAHRAVAAGAVALGGALAIRAGDLARPRHRGLALIGFALLLVQAGIGAAAVLTRLAPGAVAGHVVGGALAWATLVALATAVRRRTPRPRVDAPPARRSAREKVTAYLQLVKPDIIVLLLVTTVPAMILAAGGMPPASLVLSTLFGGTLGAAGANAINCYLDRDIDEVMARTRGRPIPAHRIRPEAALRFGVIMVAGSFAWLAVTVNVLAAALTLAAAAFYVLVYTMLMKRSTTQNIVIGGAAGAMPALVGWAAVTGSVGLPAVVLFAIVFYWTPPHFWALAMKYAGDYRAAGVPMLPAVRGSRETAVSILLYSVMVVAVSLLLYPVAGLGPLYLVAAMVLGGILVAYAVRVLRDRGARAAMALFRYSITYLGLLFAAAAADRLVGG
ncbi:MAG: heme o synthase [Actinomycetota bacterium]